MAIDAVKALDCILEAHPNATIEIRLSSPGSGWCTHVVMVKDPSGSFQRGETSGDLRHTIVKLHEAMASAARSKLEDAHEYASKLGALP